MSSTRPGLGRLRRRSKRNGAPANPLSVALAVVTAALLAACHPKPAPSESEVLVFAAASLRDAMLEVSTSYEASHPDRRVSHNFAGSNALAQQLIAAPRADLFFSASTAWMDRVEESQVVVPGTRRALLGNRLVVVSHRDADLRIGHVCDLRHRAIERLVLGNPRAVPAGVYAKQFLRATTCPAGGTAWSVLESKVLPTADVRAALAQVEMSTRVAGIVYVTDAATSDRVRVVHTISGKHAPRIVYPAARILGQHPTRADEFFSYLGDSEAAAIFERHGFVTFTNKSAFSPR